MTAGLKSRKMRKYSDSFVIFYDSKKLNLLRIVRLISVRF